MIVNYSQDPVAVKARNYYYANREKILAHKKSCYASDPKNKKSRNEANEKWRQKNLEYNHAMMCVNSKIRYWSHSSKPMAAEIIKSLKVEKRLLQMSKENRKKSMTYLPLV